MKIKAIIVDKVPDKCWDCEFSGQTEHEVDICIIFASFTDKGFNSEIDDIFNKRRSDCLLKEGKE